MKNTSITLRTGDRITFSKRKRGTVVLVNGTLWCGMERFLRELVEACAESGGSVADLLDQLGITDDGACLFCSSRRPRTLCPSCGIVTRCDACATDHDDSSLCRLTLEAAEWSRVMRGGARIEPSDRYAAIKAMAPSYLRGTVQ